MFDTFGIKPGALRYVVEHRPSARKQFEEIQGEPYRPIQMFNRADPDLVVERSGSDSLSGHFKRHNFRFLPAVSSDLDLMCYLKITMLRHDPPGSLFKNSGDIDNRLETLIDTLRVPDKQQLDKGGSRGFMEPERDETPFYSLLEDDRLVSGIEIRTEQWLEPPSQERDISDVQITVEAIIRPTKVTDKNRDFLGGWI
ncbi:MAG TPA: hypothetical protein VG944_14565 [Fimbriimonas sp.]|nr:hypothetical protein [Fimbriimonas sp.]